MSYNKQTKMYEGYIYKLLCNVNNKIYIGQTTTTIQDRWSGHKHDACRRNYKTAICKAIKKYGYDNFTIEQIEKVCCNTKEELKNQLNSLEIYYIAFYHSLTHENGYNITKGGDNSGIQQKSKTYCYTIDGVLIGEFDSRSDAGRFIGVRGEDVSGAILRRGLCMGYYFTSSPIFDYHMKQHPMYNRKIKSFDYNGTVIKEYNNCYDAAHEMNVDPANIYNACIGIHTSAYGFIWRFENENFNTHRLPKQIKRAVNQYSKDNIFINTFESIKQAATELKLNAPNISSVLAKGANKTAGGFKWFYIDDPDQPDKTRIMAA